MPVYEYEALLSNGKTDRGIMDAESESAVRNRLRSSDKYPVKIRQTKTKSGGTDKGSLSQLSIFDRIKPGEVHVMTRQLATLLGAGIPLDTALTSIIEQAENSSFKKVVAQLKESIGEGETLSQSLGRYQRLFPNMYINMVRAGEASGSLDRVLSKLADFGEKQEALLARLRAALIYPAFMAVVGMGILFILVTYVVPNITQVFEEMEKALPWPTVVLISVSSFLQQYWWAVMILLIGLFLLIKLAIRQKSGKQAWDLVKLRTPILGAVMRKAILARFSSTMESLLGSGVGIIESLEIVKRIIDNFHISKVIDQAIEDINKGRSMANAFSGSPWFPPMFVQMVAVGERSGQLEEMLTKVSDASERDVEAAVLGMTSLIEPIMIVGMGLAVGLIVLSILLPIFEMNQMIS
jgi:general secretion pathway protein F